MFFFIFITVMLFFTNSALNDIKEIQYDLRAIASEQRDTTNLIYDQIPKQLMEQIYYENNSPDTINYGN